jgi:hypothetical protein
VIEGLRRIAATRFIRGVGCIFDDSSIEIRSRSARNSPREELNE